MEYRTRVIALAALTIVSAVACYGLTPAQATKSLNEEGIVKLIELQLGDEAIVAKLGKDGVNFAVDDAAIERLKKSGESDAVIEAVRQAGKARPATAPAAAKAVTYDDVLNLLRLGIAESVILGRLEKSPTNFILGADQVEELKKAGGTEKLIEAMLGRPLNQSAGQKVTDLAIVLDCSASMGDNTRDRQVKMNVARQVVIDLVKNIPLGMNLAFIVYGHDKERRCTAVDVLRPLGPLDNVGRSILNNKVNALKPLGATPIAAALCTAGRELAKAKGPCGLVLISDGKETCNGKPEEETARLASQLDLQFGVNVIGFDVQSDERAALEEIARGGRGKYYNAANAAEFREVVRVLNKEIKKVGPPGQTVEVGDPPPPPPDRRGPKTPPLVIKPVDLKIGPPNKVGEVVCVNFSKDGTTLAWTYWDGNSCLWDLVRNEKRADLDHPSGRRNAMSPDEKIFAASSHGAVHFFDMNTGEVLRTKVAGNTESMAFSPDGKSLVTAHYDCCFIVWDVALRDRKLTVEDENTSRVRKVAFSPSGQTLATGSSDGTVRLYDVEDRKLRSTFRARADKEYPIWSLAFSPDGKTLAEGNEEAVVRLWDVATETVRTTLEGHQGHVWSLAFSPDGRYLASGSLDQTAIVWDLAQGKRRTTLKGHTNWVLSVAFSPDGKTLATGGRDHTLKLWDLSGLVGAAD